MVAMIATCSDSAKRSLISSQIGAPVHIEVPKSRRTTPQIQVSELLPHGLVEADARPLPVEDLLGDRAAVARVAELDDVARDDPDEQERHQAPPRTGGDISRKRLSSTWSTLSRSTARPCRAGCSGSGWA